MIYWGFGALAFIIARMTFAVYEVSKKNKK